VGTQTGPGRPEAWIRTGFIVVKSLHLLFCPLERPGTAQNGSRQTLLVKWPGQLRQTMRRALTPPSAVRVRLAPLSWIRTPDAAWPPRSQHVGKTLSLVAAQRGSADSPKRPKRRVLSCATPLSVDTRGRTEANARQVAMNP
jgi:hypothetical protein